MVALRPFVTDAEAVQDPRVIGVWSDSDDLFIVRANGNGYAISYSSKKEPIVYKLKAQMLKVGEARILDVTPAEDDSFRISAHTPLRVWIDGASLRVACLDSKWLRERAGKELAVEDVGDRLVITSPQEAVTRFLLAYGADERSYGEVSTLTREQ
jgi:hypothetical protein